MEWLFLFVGLDAILLPNELTRLQYFSIKFETKYRRCLHSKKNDKIDLKIDSRKKIIF